jgi:hypothetical protein
MYYFVLGSAIYFTIRFIIHLFLLGLSIGSSDSENGAKYLINVIGCPAFMIWTWTLVYLNTNIHQ